MNTEENKKLDNKGTIEIKQAFLSSAISDISNYIQLADTKVSIIMAAIVALIVGIASCHEPIYALALQIKACSWIGVSLIIFTLVFIISVITTFIFGIMTIRSHSVNIGYDSKWFISKSTTEYGYTKYKEDVFNMDDTDVIENMVAELYKLNDINRQKMKTNKWTLVSFTVVLLSAVVICVLFASFLL